jgi:hypothetical protein
MMSELANVGRLEEEGLMGRDRVIAQERSGIQELRVARIY